MDPTGDRLERGEERRRREDPIVVFLSFHTRIRAALTTLEELAASDAEESGIRKAQALVDFFEGPLTWHDLDEEGSLMPRLRAVEHPPRLERMLDACSSTHRAMDDAIEEVLPYLRHVARGGVADKERLSQASTRMRALLEPHLRLEEQEVLPLARLLLAERDLDEIADEMDRRAELRRAAR